MGKSKLWNWFWIGLGLLYFFIPLFATFRFSLLAQKGALTLISYGKVLDDPLFLPALLFSAEVGIATIFFSLVLMVFTVYWVRLRMPGLRPVVEFFTLLPFVIPAIVLVFGLIRVFSGGIIPLTATYAGTNVLLVAGYMVLGLPYIYRSVDAGLGAIDAVTLTEAAQSLGAGWFTILFRVIVPNLRAALFSAAFLTLAIVMGEFTIASFLVGLRAFGPYIWQVGQNRAYEASALVIISFVITWAFMGLLLLVGRRAPGETQIAGAR